MNYHIMTLFPEIIEQATNFSIIKRAKDLKKITINTHNIRDFSSNKHKKVDDYPFGGGSGMVMTVQPIIDCHKNIISSISGNVRTIYLSPKGYVFNQKKAIELSSYDNIVFLCGHYEGVDQRAIDLIVDEEISIGDYILTGGEIPAIVIIEATARLIGDVLNNPESCIEESFSTNLLEYPQYTRPQSYEGLEVPGALLSGNHKMIEEWRLEQSILLTLKRRKDLLDINNLTENQRKIMNKILQNNG